MIFEDAYRDTDGGPLVPRRSTKTRLTVSASGGTFGGTFTLSTRNLGKLAVDGGGGPPSLPATKSLAPFETYSATFTCEGVEASGSEGDVEVDGVFVGGDVAGVESPSASTTVVKVELEAVYVAPGNSSQSRHVYGVGEQVRFKVTPALSAVTIRAVKGDAGDLQTRYDTFDGQSETDGSASRTYTCPIASTYTPDVTVVYCGITYRPSMTVVEPQLVVTKSATASGWFWPGQVGMGTLRTENYVGPMHVSFQGIKVAEIPCVSVIPPEGWFSTTNYTGSLSHNYYAGAGSLYPITDGNYWMTDEAGRDRVCDNWSSGRLVWKIPIGWQRLQFDGDDFTHMENPDFEQWGNSSSRPLLIGGSEDSYLQVFEIDENGTASVEKFGYRLSRARTSFQGVVTKQQ